MINNIINNVINSSTNLLFESKDKIINIAKKRAEEEIKNKIPSPSALEAQLKSLIYNDEIVGELQTNNIIQNNLIKVEKTYNKFISLIDKALKRLENSQNELKSVKSKLTSISTKLNTLIGFVDILDNIFPTIKGLIPTIDGFLASSSSTLANGLLINRLGEGKKDLKDLLKKGEDCLGSIGDISDHFNKEKAKIEEPIDKAISGFEKAINTLGGPLSLENPPPGSIKAEIIRIYQEFIMSLILPELTDDGKFPNSNEILGNETLPDYIKDEDNLSTLLSDALGAGSGNNSGDNLEESSTSIVFKNFNQ